MCNPIQTSETEKIPGFVENEPEDGGKAWGVEVLSPETAVAMLLP